MSGLSNMYYHDHCLIPTPAVLGVSAVIHDVFDRILPLYLFIVVRLVSQGSDIVDTCLLTGTGNHTIHSLSQQKHGSIMWGRFLPAAAEGESEQLVGEAWSSRAPQ